METANRGENMLSSISAKDETSPASLDCIMLCYVMLCYVMLCYVMLYYDMLRYVVLCGDILSYVMLRCIGCMFGMIW